MDDDIALLAVIDAFKWWVNNDFEFLQRTQILDASGKRTSNPVGKLDLQTLRDIANAYSVTRNIPGAEGDKAGLGILHNLLKPEAVAMFSGSMSERKYHLADFARANAISVVYRTNGRLVNRQIASALSKIAWFLRPEGWTIFDRYVGAAVLRRTGFGTKQMQAFYGRLSPNFDQVSSEISEVVDQNGLHPLLTNRIIDKYLFCHGIGMFDQKLRIHGKTTSSLVKDSTDADKLLRSAVKLHRASLLSSELALGPETSKRLRTLARDIAPILSRSGWTEAPPVSVGVCS